jgi:N-acyl-D-amino-acid deacylase
MLASLVFYKIKILIMRNLLPVVFLFLFSVACKQKRVYNTIIRNGLIYDGNGGEPYQADLAINADTIALIGDLKDASAANDLDAKGMAVAPGFINMLSHSEESLIQDGRSQGDIRQGVTLEVLGESSMGPLNAIMKKQAKDGQVNIKYEVGWNTLGEYLNFLEKKGISCNIASFVGTGSIRQYVIGEANLPPSPAQLDTMKLLVDQAMEEGAMGVTNALIYPPDFFAKTDELIPLAKEASKYGGMYISHMRSEGNKLFEAVDELISISRQADIPAEIYHLKEAGKGNWWKLDSLIKKVEQARKEGLKITADMYTYSKSATGLTAVFPPTLQDGGFDKLWNRLQDKTIRAEMKKAMNTNAQDWENTYYQSGGATGVLLLGFKQDSLRKYIGKTLAEVAAIRGHSPEETAMDLIVEDSTRIEVVYSSMNEDNVKKEVALPWVSFGSDAGSAAPEGVFLLSNPHPRAYGNFARVIGKFVRDEKVLSLQQAIYKLAKLPATNLKIGRRGELKAGNYADIVIFEPDKVQDHASFEKPNQYSTGVLDVFVNGVQVLKDGEHTGATPGRFIKGPGYKKGIIK